MLFRSSNIFVLEDNQVEIESHEEDKKPRKIKDKLFIKRHRKNDQKAEVIQKDLPLDEIENANKNDIDMKLPTEKPHEENLEDSNVLEIRNGNNEVTSNDTDDFEKQIALLDDDQDSTVEKTEGVEDNDRK